MATAARIREGELATTAWMIDLVRRGEIDRDSNVLYAHMGQPALNAYTGAFL